MIATIEFMKKNFPKYNELYFNGELPEPSFELFSPKTTLGQFQWCQRLDKFANKYEKYIIRLSTYYDRPEHDLAETLVHEMIHYYIRYKRIVDNGSHGRAWKAYADKINDMSDFHISRVTNTSGCHINSEIKERKAKTKSNVGTLFMYQKDELRWFAFMVSESNVEKYRNWIKGKVESKFGFTSHAYMGNVYLDGEFEHYSKCRTKVHGYWKSETEVMSIVQNKLLTCEEFKR